MKKVLLAFLVGILAGTSSYADELLFMGTKGNKKLTCRNVEIEKDWVICENYSKSIEIPSDKVLLIKKEILLTSIPLSFSKITVHADFVDYSQDFSCISLRKHKDWVECITSQPSSIQSFSLQINRCFINSIERESGR
jgi:hypothetical protein